MVLIQQEHAGAILCLGTPNNTEFGVDYYSYTVSDQFIGFNDVPFGVHYIYYSISGKDSPGGPRISIFFVLNNITRYHVIQYNNDLEVFELVSQDSDLYSETVAKYEQGQFGNRIGPYPHDHTKQWRDIADYITPSTVDRLQPIHKFIYSTLTTEEETVLRQHQDKVDPNRKFSSESTNDGRVYYTHIPRKLKKQGATPQEITKINFDKSALLEQLLADYKHEQAEKELLAEFQFAFVCFLIGQCQDALEQWKNIIELLCNCDEAMESHEDLFTNFIQILKKQLHSIPKDFFVDELSERNFLTKTLTSLYGIISEDSPENVQNQAIELKSQLLEQFNWTLDQDDDPDDAPFVVEE
jgi:A1 cistron-splicing factor AAR2